MQICTKIIVFCTENMFFFVYFRKIHYLCGKFAEYSEKVAGINYKDITMERENYWQKLRKVLINKYAITLYIFALLFMFMGNHSVVQYMKRAKKMHALEEQLDQTNQEIQEAQSVMQVLDNMDSLEQFAREKYRMHAPNEDVYVIE